LEKATADREYLCSNRFTIADICVSYVLVLAQSLEIQEAFTPHIQSYWDRITQRPAFQEAFQR